MRGSASRRVLVSRCDFVLAVRLQQQPGGGRPCLWLELLAAGLTSQLKSKRMVKADKSGLVRNEPVFRVQPTRSALRRLVKSRTYREPSGRRSAYAAGALPLGRRLHRMSRCPLAGLFKVDCLTKSGPALESQPWRVVESPLHFHSDSSACRIALDF